MSSLSRNEYPKPKSWVEFEDMVLAALSVKWNSPNLQKHGRQGQAQNGLDIYGPDDLGRPTGIQCKKWAKALNIRDVEEEVEKSDQSHDISTCYLATTNSTDAKLQMEVRALSRKRASQGKSAVAMLFWEDIIGSLILEPKVFNQFYPGMPLPNLSPEDEISQRRAAFDLGTYAAALPQYVKMTSENNPFVVSDYDRLFNIYTNILQLIDLYTTSLTLKDFSERVSVTIKVIIPIIEKDFLTSLDVATISAFGKKLEDQVSFIRPWILDRNIARFFEAAYSLEYCANKFEISPFQRKAACLSIGRLFPNLWERVRALIKPTSNDETDDAWIQQIKNMIINEEVWGFKYDEADQHEH